MLANLVTDITLYIRKLRNREWSVRIFAAVNAPARKKARKFCRSDSIKLFLADVIDSLLKIGNLVLKAFDKPFGYLSEKNTALAARVKKLSVRIFKEFLREQSGHLVRYFRWCEDFVTGEVGQTVQNVRVIYLVKYVAIFLN